MVASALFLLAALSSSFFTLVRAAAPFPVVVDTFTGGATAKIGWNAATDPGWDSMTVELMGGSNWAMNHLTTVAINQNGMADGSVQFNVPCITPYGKYYFVRFTSSNSNIPPNYSTRFTIQSSTGETDPTPNMIEPDGSAIPWANGTIVSCSASSSSTSSTPASSSTSSTPASSSSSSSSSSSTPAPSSTPASGSSSTPASGSSSTPASGSSSTPASSSSSTPASSSSSSTPAPSSTDSSTGPASSSTTSSGGRSSSVVLTPTPTPTPAPTGGSSTVTVTVTETITKWGRHPPPGSSSKWTTSTSSQSTSTSTQSPTPTPNGNDLFTFSVTPQTNAVTQKSKNAGASVKRHLGVGSIVAVFVGVGVLIC